VLGRFLEDMAAEKQPQPPMPLASVLLVGANGFLGRTIPPLLAARHPKCSITLLDIAPEKTLPHPYVRADITDESALIDVLKRVRPAVVIHSASPPIPTVGKGDEKLFFRVNVDGTRNVIKACTEAGVKALVYTSSASVIYDGGDLVNANEKTPYATRHVDPYNASKVTAPSKLTSLLISRAHLQSRSKPRKSYWPQTQQHSPLAPSDLPGFLVPETAPSSQDYTMSSKTDRPLSKLEIMQICGTLRTSIMSPMPIFWLQRIS
jgi:hypothetical protein